MELHQIRAFVAVARVGNVTRAADALCVTQPAVTAQIKGLESSLGVALFDRSGGRMTLTRAGDRLLPQAEALLSAASELKGAARNMQGELSGRIDLGLPGESPEFLRTGSLSVAVQRSLPLVELHTRTHAVGHLLDQVRGGGLAGAFTISVHPPRDLQWIALRSVCYRIAFPPRLAAEMQRGGWRVLAGLPWVDGTAESHVHQMLRGLFEQQGLTPNVVMRSDDTSSLETFVRAGSACALLREEVAVPGVERGDWVVWGHARVDAQLYFSSAAERASDPLVVALASAVQSVWA
ncbi:MULTISPECIES: LysR family transcriptional regulator [unclassified Variovorax]|jgi:DNA-binding transcriptional LysR family regulator|uniref:LysR family transcriptional regulator n=1 Tax=unclassified Variovorax TaxID=663243 RepID=UPI00164D2FDA|nr:LysR family transcriptional regulator [Variovorax sp. PAMC26660]QNK69343.1 LysR family transcriptional regulator [Variovorax sp. PAMC26660]